MNKEVLRQELNQMAQTTIEQAMEKVEQAPDGQWIAASEWPVRELFAKFARDCYQVILQARSDAHPTARQAAFSPGGRSTGPAEQRGAYPTGVNRRRRS